MLECCSYVPHLEEKGEVQAALVMEDALFS